MVVDVRLAVTQVEVEVSRGILVLEFELLKQDMDYQRHALRHYYYSRMLHSGNSACSKMYMYGYSASVFKSHGDAELNF